MITEFERDIYTGISATLEHDDIFHAILGQMSDGMWENCTGMEAYWENAIIRTDATMHIMVNRQWFWGTRTWCVHSTRRTLRMNPYYKMDAKRIIKYFAGKLKQIIKAEVKYLTGKGVAVNDDTRLDWLSYGSNVRLWDAKAVLAQMELAAK